MVGKIKELPLGDSMIVEVKRNYKNVEGIFQSDSFKCYLWAAISKKVSLNCKEGDLVAVKGRLIEDEGICKILAEQVVLLNKMIDKGVNIG